MVVPSFCGAKPAATVYETVGGKGDVGGGDGRTHANACKTADNKSDAGGNGTRGTVGNGSGTIPVYESCDDCWRAH